MHSIEDLFDLIRKGEMDVDPEMLDTVLGSLDAVDSIFDDIENCGTSDIDVTDHQEKLKSLINEDMNDIKEEDMGGMILSQKDEPRPKKGTSILLVTISKDCVLPSVRTYQILERFTEGSVDIKSSKPEVEQYESLGPGDQIEIEIDPSFEDRSMEILGSIGEITFSLVKDESPKDIEPEVRGKKSKKVKVSVNDLDSLMNITGELIISKSRLKALLKHSEDRELIETLGILDRITEELQERMLSLRLMPLSYHFKKFPRMVRDQSRSLGKDIDLEITGDNVELDRTVLDVIGDPLVHLIRNSIDHGIESPEERRKKNKPIRGTIKISAAREKDIVRIDVEDDGKGLENGKILRKALENGFITESAAGKLDNDAILELIFLPGFSTSEKVSQISGRGVGMDSVKNTVESIGGRVTIHSVKDKGTRISLALPISLAIINALMVRAEEERYAIPLTSIERVIDLSDHKMTSMEGNQMIEVDRSILRFFDLTSFFSGDTGKVQSSGLAILIETSSNPIAMKVDGLLGEQDIVVKTLGKSLKEVKGISGATIIDNGEVVLILDTTTIGTMVSQGVV
jgi:two-component system chemotaxis sensor kinase CheA